MDPKQAFLIINNTITPALLIKRLITAPFFPQQNIYLTQNPQQLPEILQKAKDHKINTFFIAGGDGTVYNFVNTYRTFFPNTMANLQIAIIPIGTNNHFALNNQLAFPIEIIEKYHHTININKSPTYFLESETRLTPYIQFGTDAKNLPQLDILKMAIKNSPLANFIPNKLSIPKTFMFTAINEASLAFKLSHSNSLLNTILKDRLILRKKCVSISCFPRKNNQNTNLKNFFELRATLPKYALFPKILQTQKSPSFLCQKIFIKSSEPTPLRLAGDSFEPTKTLSLTIHHEPLIFFTPSIS